jgi:hypothetical protein
MGCGSSSQGQVAEHAVTIEQRRPPSKERVQVETSASNELEKEENTVLQEENTALNGSVVKTDGEASNDVVATEGMHEERSHDPVTSDDLTIPTENIPPQVSTDKPIAFEVPFSDDQTSSSKKPPRRLEQMTSGTQLTSDDLKEKQRVAEENRRKEIEKRATGGQRMSRKERLRREIQEARETSKQQQAEEIERKQSAGSEKREKIMEEKIDKLRKKEEHAKKVRGRAVEVSESESYVDNLEIETDTGYNAEDDDADVWST